MSEEPNTSGSGSVTPTPPSGVTPAPASSGVTPPAKPAPTVEELLRKQEELEQSLKNAREAEDRLGKKLSVHEKAQKERETAEQAAKDAQLSEIERTKKQYTEIEAERDTLKHELQQLRVHAAVERHAQKLQFEYPEAAAKLMDWSQIEYDESGAPKNVDKLLDNLAKAMPKLIRDQPATTPAQTATPPATQTPAIPAMNPGRSSIPGPGGNTPGRIPQWNEVFKRP